MTSELVKAKAGLLVETVRLQAYLAEGTEPKVDKKGVTKVVQRLESAGPSAHVQLNVCRDALLDKRADWSVRAAIIAYMSGWYQEESHFRGQVLDASGAVNEAKACFALCLEDENSLVRQSAQAATARLNEAVGVNPVGKYLPG